MKNQTNCFSNINNLSIGAQATALMGTVSALKQSKGLVSAQYKMNKLINKAFRKLQDVILTHKGKKRAKGCICITF